MDAVPQKPNRRHAAHALLVDTSQQVVAAFNDAVTTHPDLAEAVVWLRDRVQDTDDPVVLGANCDHAATITGIFAPLGVQVISRVSPGSALLGNYFASVLDDHPEISPDTTQPVRERKGRTLVVATDASWRRGRDIEGTWAAVADTGSYLIGRVRRSHFGPEEQALIAAYLRWSRKLRHRDDRLILLSDCQHAVRSFDRWLPTSASDRFCVRRTEVRWVRGHAGHPLNDAADRLALCARRMLPAELPREFAERLVESAVEAYAEEFPQAS